MASWTRGAADRRRDPRSFHKLVVTLGLDLDPGTDPGADSAGIRDEPPLGAGPAVEIPRLGHWPQEVKQALRDTDSYTFPAPREQLLLHMVQGVPAVAEVFLEAQWLMRADGVPLLTSDEPISLYRKPTPANQHLGLGPAGAEMIQVPLSPSRCLVMNRVGRLGPDVLVDVPHAAIAEINTLTLHGRWHQLFRHPDGPKFPAPPPLPERFVEVN